jgi:hypothetical protein
VSGYDLHSIPPKPNGSRFALTETASGIGASPALAVATAASTLATERVQACRKARPEPVTLKLYHPTLTDQGEPVVAPRGVLVAEPQFESSKPGKITGRVGPEAVDSFLLGETEWAEMPDREVMLSAAHLLAAEGINPLSQEARRLADSLCIALAARAGVLVENGRDLPAPGTPH